jgi:hypothetical protein
MTFLYPAAADAEADSRDPLDVMRDAAQHVTNDTLHPSDVARLVVATAAAVEYLAGGGGYDFNAVSDNRETVEAPKLHNDSFAVTPATAVSSMLEIAEAQLALSTRLAMANERIADVLEQLLARVS